MRKLLLSAAALIASLAGAHAAQTQLTIVISGPPSTTLSCPLTTYTAPLAAGAQICAISVQPTNWSGVLALSGNSSSSFLIQGSNLVVGPAALAAGSYSVTITSTP